MKIKPPHSFHIPVMGLAYTIDTPIKVARYGIASVMSIGEDRLVEMMRNHYCKVYHKQYIPITKHEPDYRARRITAYLDLVNTIVKVQMQTLKNSEFAEGSEITKYFRMLAAENPLKQIYNHMLETASAEEKRNMQETLRLSIDAGSIDVNIMTKTDRNNYDESGEVIKDGSDAVAALRGFANSQLKNTSIIFSAGLNPRLFSYLENFSCFQPDENGSFEKKIIIKVSDFRSASIQGKYLAKKGIWVSEFRIESGLNCGGHAFATDGYLMGPILQEFHGNREQLHKELFGIYKNALTGKGMTIPAQMPELRLSVQGGIGTSEEDRFLKNKYGMDSTGWGTPFLLVPEATTVDDETLKLLTAATKKEVVLSHNSPLGVRYYYLKGTTAEKEKEQRILNKKPGSPCTEKHLAFNTEFTEKPICTASTTYQKLKINDLRSKIQDLVKLKAQIDAVLTKECLCIGLSNAASAKYQIHFLKNLKAVTICPGPNIANFSKVVSLETMAGHIYGSENLLEGRMRPHMFVEELQLYIDYLKETLENDPLKYLDNKKINFYKSFFFNLQSGISYYRDLYYSLAICDDNFIDMLNQKAATLNSMQNHYLHYAVQDIFQYADVF